MTVQEFVKHIEGKVFKSKQSFAYLTLSPLDASGRGILQTKDGRGRLNSCFYYLEEEGGDLFISYMDREYLIIQLREGQGFEMLREDRIEEFIVTVEEPTLFSDN